MVPRKVLARAAGDSWGDYLKYLPMDLRKVEAGEEIGTLRSGGGGGGEVEAWKTLSAHMYPPGPLRPAPILCRDATSHVPNAVTWRESGLIAGASLSAVAHHATDFNFPFQTLPPSVITRICIDNEGIVE